MPSTSYICMKSTKYLGTDIYPEITLEELDNINSRLARFGGIKLIINVGEGNIRFEYDETILEPKETPGDLSFYDTKTKTRIITYLENFGELDIYGPGDYKDENIIIKIPILL